MQSVTNPTKAVSFVETALHNDIRIAGILIFSATKSPTIGYTFSLLRRFRQTSTPFWTAARCIFVIQATATHPYLLRAHTLLKQNYPSDPPKYPPTQQNSENATADASPHKTPAGHPS